MAWQISDDEFLISGRSYPIYLSLSVNSVRLPDGSLVTCASEYFRVSGTGRVLEWYAGPSSSTLEEVLYVINIHCVIASSLYGCVWTERYGHEGKLEARIRLDHLRAISNDGLPFVAMRVVEAFHARHDEAP